MLHKHIAFAGLAFAALALLPATSALGAETKPHVDASGENMQPAYPTTALPNRERGAVIVSAEVRSDGTVSKVALRQSSGFADLDNAAANAVNGWKFVPASKDGVPTDGWTSVQIVFTPPN
ncbi:MAG TPA: energy transducer TonB [Rhizomicrobium sp.]|jgi:protein TonB